MRKGAESPAARAVLLAEDNPDDALLMRRACVKAGLLDAIHHVENGEEAVAYLQNILENPSRARIPLLILLDVKMPRLDGFEVLKWIKKQPNFCKVPVVMLSTSNLETDMKRAQVLGVSSYFVKPKTFDELIGIAHEIHTKWLAS